MHADTLDPIASNSVFDTYGRNICWAFPFRHIVHYREVLEVEWPNQIISTAKQSADGVGALLAE